MAGLTLMVTHGWRVMKTSGNVFIILALLIGLGIGYVIFGAKDTISLIDAQTTEKQLYTCGMHPEIVTREPGYCPECGMKLVPKKDEGES